MSLSTDRKKDAVEIEIGGEKRWLYYSTNAVAELERVLDTKAKRLHVRLAATYHVTAQVLAQHADGDGVFTAEHQAAIMREVDREDLEFSTIEIRALLWGGLLHDNPNLTPEEAGDIIDEVPGDDGQTREAYVFGRAMLAFLSRTASRRMTDLWRDAIAESDRMRESSSETGRSSAGSPSGSALPNPSSGS